jgi:hypothetical protein
MRKALIGIVALVSLLAACYASLPWLLNALVLPRVVERMDLDALHIDMGYPSLTSLRISRMQLEAAPVKLTANNLELTYNLQDLRSGRLENIVVQQLELAVLMPETDPHLSSDPERTVGQLPRSQLAAPESLLALVPADRISVEHLEITVPTMNFAGRGSLSLDEAGLEAELEGIRPAIARDLKATMAMSRAGTLHFSLEDPDPEAPSSVRLLAEPEDTRLPVQGTFSIEGYGLRLVQELAGIPAGKGNVSGELATSLPWPLEDLPGWQTISATAHVNIDWSLADPAIELNDLTATVELEQGRLTVRPKGKTRLSTQTVSVAGTLDGGAFTYLDGFITSEDARLTLIADTGRLSGQAIVATLRMTSDAPLEAALTGSLQLRLYAAQQAEEHVQIINAYKGAVTRETQEATQAQGNLSATLTKVGQTIKGTFEFNGSADASALADLPGLRLQQYPFDLTGDYTLTNNNLAAGASLRAGPIIDLPVEVEHNLDRSSGLLTFSHTQTIDEPLLHRLLPGWQEPYDLDGGVLELSGKLTWDEQLHGSIELQPKALTAHYDDYTLINAAGALNLALTDSDLVLLPSTLTVEAIDIGIPVTNVALSIAGSLEKLAVSQAAAELLGGRASAEPFDYEVETGKADIRVALSDIDLSEVLALEGDNLSGSGRLSGIVPVLLRGNDLSIEAGEVAAHIPGKIMLSPDLTAAITQPGLDIALKALENFNYQALAVNVNYDSEGNMLLGVRLEGSNPDLENGRPVHFNLNISENIPVLLKSLRLQDNFTKTLERRITR